MRVAAQKAEPVTPKLEPTTPRPKSTHGPSPGSARAKLSREGTALSASEGGAAAAGKADGHLTLQAKKTAAAAPRHPTGVKDKPLASGAGENVAVVKAEGPASALEEHEGHLKAMLAPFLVLVAELASRHSLLLEAHKGTDVYNAEAPFAATLSHRQAEALQVMSPVALGVSVGVTRRHACPAQAVTRHSDQAANIMRTTVEENALMRGLLEKENSDLIQKLEECTKDLERERAAAAKLKNSKLAMDSSIKQMRTKIKDVEATLTAKVAEDDAKLKEQSALVHSLNQKMRSRNVVLEQRGKELEQREKELQAALTRIAELESGDVSKQQLNSRLSSVTQMLQLETKNREKAELKLKATAAKLSQIGMAREAGDDAAPPAKTDLQAELEAELEQLRANRDGLKAQLEQLREASSSDISELRTELKSVMGQLEARSRQLENKDAELKHYLALRPGETTREEMEAMKEMFAELATHNERLDQELGQCRQELARRDKMMADQENVLRVRDNLISVLHNREGQGLQGLQWPQEAAAGRKLIDLHAIVERKSVRIKAYEQQIKQMEKQLESSQVLRTTMETRIAQLEHMVAVAGMTKQALGKPPCRVNVASW
ncbi:cingulin-like isoform X1 [Thrips palmi]|uniref:Cingulin-like isoform X1 n=1 Tax=Thrips palmi TaxID=161013 RepID=A0A6P8ZL75_THRPL|nr:cingulin-like isoform X1 [Thrips palmi]